MACGGSVELRMSSSYPLDTIIRHCASVHGKTRTEQAAASLSPPPTHLVHLRDHASQRLVHVLSDRHFVLEMPLALGPVGGRHGQQLGL